MKYNLVISAVTIDLYPAISL